jgi:hypothetical protein
VVLFRTLKDTAQYVSLKKMTKDSPPNKLEIGVWAVSLGTS